MASSREQFEQAYDRGEFLALDGPYDNPRKNQAFAVWQASRQAVVVELPGGYDPYRCGDDAEMNATNDTIQECRAAIEAQGLKVAP